jgi:AcrR family transcriptional regulator
MAATPGAEGLSANQAARRQRVVIAAMDLAGRGGYDAVQMRDVAASAGVALGTIYRYFTSKDHVLAAALVEWSNELRRQVAQRPPRGETVADQVVDVVRRGTRRMEQQPQLAAALVTAITSPDPAVSECQREVTGAMVDVLGEPMGELPDELRAGVVRVLSHVWFSALVAWVNGATTVGRVGDELESAARLMLEGR